METKGIICLSMFIVSVLSLLFTEIGAPWMMYIVGILAFGGWIYFIGAFSKTSNRSDK